MDNKRAAIVATAGVGLLVSAFVLRKLTYSRRKEPSAPEVKAVVLTDDRHHIPHRNHAADPV